jgi:hypothetical protein
MRSAQLQVAIAVVASLLCACAATQKPESTMASRSAAPRRSIDEADAVALIHELLLEARLDAKRGWQVSLPDHHGLRVDLRVGDSLVGVEWVSANDRARYGRDLPPPDPDGQLRVLSVSDPRDPRPALVLLLDATSYEYAADEGAALRGAPDERDVEKRLHHDLLDFLAFADAQHSL